MSGMLPLRDTDPREVSGYRLLGRLGEGGQGVVFLALSPSGIRAAIKLLSPTTDPRVRSRFLKEVSAAQQVAGFCTAQVLDAGIFERRPFIVSEYVSGPSLVEVVQQHGPRSGDVLERIAVATLTALGAVHAVGMVHRDFKPGNVLLGPDGPVVIDFGLAAVPGMTTTGLSGQVAVGTPAFMAPEQLAGQRVTAAADMWSWAVTIAFTGTGELPFKGESLTATAYAILHSEPTLGPLPEPLGSIVRGCLSKNQASRPAARGALSELEAAGARLTGPLPPVARALPQDEATPSPPPASATPPGPQRGSDNGLIGVPPAPGPQPAQPTPGPQSAQPTPGPQSAQPAPESHPAQPVSESQPAQPVPEPQSARPGGGWIRRRWRATAVLTSILLVAGATGVALVLALRGAPPERPAGSYAGSNQPSNPEAAARAQAVTWIVQQVSRAAVVACDPQVCADLHKGGLPFANLMRLGPTSNDPIGSTLVVATAPVRAQFGSRLASVWAPAIIASFGSGNARIDIRLMYPGGGVQYRADQQEAAQDRKAADTLLLTNPQIRLSATARKQLRSGEIDPRLPLLIDTLANAHPLQIADFGGQSPGGGPASLLRSVDLAAANRAHLTPAATLSWIQAFTKVQRAEYHPALSQVTLPTGGAWLRISYAAPSPLAADLMATAS
jgi:serine/threonine protein kinase